jgi:hypothetical protein
MKKISLLVTVLLCVAFVFAETPLTDWTLLWNGSWEESKTLNNQGQLSFSFLPLGLVLRAEALDRHTMNPELNPPWGDPEKGITEFLGGLYHKPTGSRLLYGVLDEWGLSARIRNPWIRSAPFAENHKPLMADLKTAASATKNDEAYLYLSSPTLNFIPNAKLRSFVSAQTETEQLTPAFSTGFDVLFAKKYDLLVETFYTGFTLPPKKGTTWFSSPLPERDFNLYALGALFTGPLFSLSSDWAWSETFAWGSGFYGNAGFRLTPILSKGRISKPLSISLAVDGAQERFVYRDGLNHGAGFRSAAKIEWKGGRNSLFRANALARSSAIGEDFDRYSAGLYYRFQTAGKNSFPFQFTRISLSADQNKVNPAKINEGINGNMAFSVKLPKNISVKPVGINFHGFYKSNTLSDTGEQIFDTGGASGELSWSPANYQFKTKLGYAAFEKKDDKWDFSASATARFKHGRLGVKAASPDFPDKWNWTITWKVEKR